MENLIDSVFSTNADHGISDSLDGKIHAALYAHTDLNANNDAAAINALNAFINTVEAQSGKKIGQADADALIADALAIIAALTVGMAVTWLRQIQTRVASYSSPRAAVSPATAGNAETLINSYPFRDTSSMDRILELRGRGLQCRGHMVRPRLRADDGVRLA